MTNSTTKCRGCDRQVPAAADLALVIAGLVETTEAAEASALQALPKDAPQRAELLLRIVDSLRVRLPVIAAKVEGYCGPSCKRAHLAKTQGVQHG